MSRPLGRMGVERRMVTNTVNLDAMIVRDDMAITYAKARRPEPHHNVDTRP